MGGNPVSHLYLQLLGDMGLLLAGPVIALIVITSNSGK
jgi:hypothetical protein